MNEKATREKAVPGTKDGAPTTKGADAAPAASAAPSAGSVVIGVLAGIDEGGRPLVAFAANPAELPIAAKTVAAIDADAVGRAVALLFESGDLARPILIGVVHGSVDQAAAKSDAAAEREKAGPERQARAAHAERRGSATPTAKAPSGSSDAAAPELLIDGERVAIEARREIVLRCGKASITMTRAGKVIVRGAYVSTRSSGVNRIRGGSVQIN